MTLKEIANRKAVKYRNDSNQNQGDQALTMLSVIFGAAAAVAGAVAFPWLYATNFGVGVAMVVTGAVSGGIAGAATPFILDRAIGSRPAQYLRPSTYREYFAARKAAPNTPKNAQ